MGIDEAIGFTAQPGGITDVTRILEIAATGKFLKVQNQIPVIIAIASILQIICDDEGVKIVQPPDLDQIKLVVQGIVIDEGQIRTPGALARK